MTEDVIVGTADPKLLRSVLRNIVDGLGVLWTEGFLIAALRDEADYLEAVRKFEGTA